MSKATRITLVCLFVFALGFLQVPQSVSAQGTTPLAGGTWEYIGVEGALVPLDLEVNPAPDGLQVMDWKMLKVAKPVQVCHPFRAGQFGWYAYVVELKDGVWVKIPTTQGWIPEVDGRMMACADLPGAGTYALFGGFDGPAGESGTTPVLDYSQCNGVEITRDWEFDGDTYYGWLTLVYLSHPDPLVRVPFTYTIINSNYPMTGDLTATLTSDVNGYVNFSAYEWQYPGPYNLGSLTYTIRVESPYCYYEWGVSNPAPPV